MRLSLYLIREVWPQFLSAVVIICSVLIISQLARMAEVLVTFGLNFENVVLPLLFVVLPFLSICIPIACLFGVILGFARLSSDGEYTAMLAVGFPLSRAVRPVMVMAVFLYGVAAWSSLYMEPWGRREFSRFLFDKARTELDNMVRFKLQPGVFLPDFLGYTLYAEEVSEDRTQLKRVMLAPMTHRPEETDFVLVAPEGSIVGSVETGELTMTLINGQGYSAAASSPDAAVLRFRRADIDLLRLFSDRVFGSSFRDDDYRAFYPARLWGHVTELAADPRTNGTERYFKARSLLHQRIAAPFAVISFALFAMALGLQDPRHGKSQALVGGILVTIASYVLVMGFKWLADRGSLSAPVAAWLPQLLLAAMAWFWVYQRSRLPLSESPFDPAYAPWKPLPQGSKLS